MDTSTLLWLAQVAFTLSRTISIESPSAIFTNRQDEHTPFDVQGPFRFSKPAEGENETCTGTCQAFVGSPLVHSVLRYIVLPTCLPYLAREGKVTMSLSRSGTSLPWFPFQVWSYHHGPQVAHSLRARGLTPPQPRTPRMRGRVQWRRYIFLGRPLM